MKQMSERGQKRSEWARYRCWEMSRSGVQVQSVVMSFQCLRSTAANRKLERHQSNSQRRSLALQLQAAITWTTSARISHKLPPSLSLSHSLSLYLSSHLCWSVFTGKEGDGEKETLSSFRPRLPLLFSQPELVSQHTHTHSDEELMTARWCSVKQVLGSNPSPRACVGSLRYSGFLPKTWRLIDRSKNKMTNKHIYKYITHI